MAENQRWQAIPTQLDLAAFEQFVLPHLSPGSRGPAPKLSLHKIFNYILKHMYLGCQWKELAIDKDGEGSVEIHYTRIYRTWRRWVGNGFIDAIFAGSVSRLHQDGLLDTTVIHGDGTTTAAKKGGDNLGFSGHKKVKGDKVVAFCDRHCNVIAPFVPASWLVKPEFFYRIKERMTRSTRTRARERGRYPYDFVSVSDHLGSIRRVRAAEQLIIGNRGRESLTARGFLAFSRSCK